MLRDLTVFKLILIETRHNYSYTVSMPRCMIISSTTTTHAMGKLVNVHLQLCPWGRFPHFQVRAAAE